MMTDERMKWVQLEMEAYDRLTPELKAVVQEYGNLPWSPDIYPEEFRAQEEQMRKLEQEWLFMQGV